jgi:hypothetical protein
MPLAVLSFFLSICTFSYLASFTLLVVNNNLTLCFLTLLLSSLTCWLLFDNWANWKTDQEISEMNNKLENLKFQVLHLKTERALLLENINFMFDKHKQKRKKL